MGEVKTKCLIALKLFFTIFDLYFFGRVMFIIYNWADLEISDIRTFILILLNGARFDISAILFTNIVLTPFFLIPRAWYKNVYLFQIFKYTFFVVNGCFIILNSIDIVYYPFVQKRMQSDTFLFITGDKGDELYKLIPTFILEYWWVWGIMFLFLYVGYKMTNPLFLNFSRNPAIKSGWFYHFAFIVGLVSFFIIGSRGGMQLRPIGVIQATDVAGVVNSASVLNTPFSILKTWENYTLEKIEFFEPSEISDCESGIYQDFIGDTLSLKPNIVIIMVESLSKSYLEKFGGPVALPFLDSLMDESLVFTNAFANARESVQGVPAVCASIPSMMDDAFIFSKYATNKINSIPSVLKNSGYTSSFFHAGTTGTMGFDAFCSMASVDYYYGKEDYPDQGDHDGGWGIWDHKFFPFMVNKLSEISQPFFTCVLTMNPHSPFRIPEEFKNKYHVEGQPVESCLRYEDHALSIFFQNAKNQAWYPNTLFIITADHTGPRITEGTKMDDFRIPIIFFTPKSDSIGINNKVIGQIDIMPTVLNIVKNEIPYFSMGKNIFESSCKEGTIVFHSGIYHYIDDTYYIQYSGKDVIGMYLWKKIYLQRKRRSKRSIICTLGSNATLFR